MIQRLLEVLCQELRIGAIYVLYPTTILSQSYTGDCFLLSVEVLMIKEGRSVLHCVCV